MGQGSVSNTKAVTANSHDVLPEHILSRSVIISLQKMLLKLLLLQGGMLLFYPEQSIWNMLIASALNPSYLEQSK